MVKKLRDPSAGPLLGIDQSATGSAAVILVDGKLTDMFFYADTKTSYKNLGADSGALPPLTVKAGDESGRTARLMDLRTNLRNLTEKWRPTYAALEDYALARKAFAHTLGEVGGMVRLVFSDARVPFRVYDVHAVKMFATGRGDAEKADVILACRDAWENLNFLTYGRASGAGGNLADAYVIAQLLRTELQLRAGLVTLEEIPDERRRVFIRTTKQKPINILDLPFAEVNCGG